MVEIESYIHKLMTFLEQSFGSRLLYVGLQGSYLRGEATESSDVDIMVVLEALTVHDLAQYRSLIESLDHADKSCGFICSRQDLANWNPLEIHHLVHSTRDYYGKLTDFVPAYTHNDVRNFAKMSLNNLYHELCHRYIHGNRMQTAEALPGMYKSAFFILQNVTYLRLGDFAQTKQMLLSLLTGKDREVLTRAMHFEEMAFEENFQLLFDWCQETLRNL